MVNRTYVLVAVLLVAVESFSMSTCFAADRTIADQALANAENDLTSAYHALTKAQDAGANVSDLFGKFNIAAGTLADAYNSYRTGDYERARTFALNCSDSVDGIVGRAASLQLEAENSAREELLLNAVVSTIGSAVLVVLGLLGWKYLKRAYLKRILLMKPETENSK